MSVGIRSVDHPVIAVEDFERSRIAYERLGFTVPPMGTHLEWGTGNWCIMFERDYLELRGVVDAERYTHHLDAFLRNHGEGLMGVAFTPVATAAASEAAARASGLHPTALKSLTRRFQWPEGEVFPEFSILYLDEAELPELLTSVICEHLTPRLLRRSEWLEHANGVVGVNSLCIVVEEPAALYDRYAKLFGASQLTLTDARLVAQPPEGARIEFLTESEARRSGVLTNNVRKPAMCALTLGVRDIQQTRAVLETREIPVTVLENGRIRAPASHACGVNLLFEARR